MKLTLTATIQIDEKQVERAQREEHMTREQVRREMIQAITEVFLELDDDTCGTSWNLVSIEE